MMSFAMMWASPNDVALRANGLTNPPFYGLKSIRGDVQKRLMHKDNQDMYAKTN